MKTCTKCGKTIEQQGFSRSTRCDLCARRKPINRKDVEYDYRFARHIMRMNHHDAALWIERGYRVTDRTVERWKLHQYDDGLKWQIDPLDYYLAWAET